jgi:hypothetical protein
MVDYVESPFEQIISIHLDKSKPGDGGPGDGGPNVCVPGFFMRDYLGNVTREPIDPHVPNLCTGSSVMKRMTAPTSRTEQTRSGEAPVWTTIRACTLGEGVIFNTPQQAVDPCNTYMPFCYHYEVEFVETVEIASHTNLGGHVLNTETFTYGLSFIPNMVFPFIGPDEPQVSGYPSVSLACVLDANNSIGAHPRGTLYTHGSHTIVVDPPNFESIPAPAEGWDWVSYHVTGGYFLITGICL